MAMLVIDSVDLPNPRAYGVETYDGDDDSTGRLQNYQMFRHRIYSEAYAIPVSWRVNWTDLEAICAALEPDEFECKFLDPTHATTTTRTMYCGPRKSSLVQGQQATDTSTAMWDLTTTIIDMCVS